MAQDLISQVYHIHMIIQDIIYNLTDSKYK